MFQITKELIVITNEKAVRKLQKKKLINRIETKLISTTCYIDKLFKTFILKVQTSYLQKN